jgi:3-oxoacyl-ACP reductase-like protein
MSNRLYGMSALFASAFVAAMSAGCLATAAHAPTPEPEKFPQNAGAMAHALVAGDKAALKLFNEKLKEIERVRDLQEAFIACQFCGDLDTAAPLDRLDYYYAIEHTQKPHKMLEAWQAARADAIGRKLALTLDQNLLHLPQPACPPSPPAPVCFSAPWCTKTMQCDKDQNVSGCQKCE